MIKLLVFLLNLWQISIGSEPCTTPNGEKALCQPLSVCEILLPALTSKDATIQQFFEASKCGNFMVCCGTSANFTERPKNSQASNETSSALTKEAHRAYVLEKLLPNRRTCGQQHLDDYVQNFTKTSVDEFPWLVYIKQKSLSELDSKDKELKCVGTLISSRYIITNEECADQPAFPLEEIKLGQYNRFNDSDCIEWQDMRDCSAPPVLVEIEETLRFPDIGLILFRLKKRIQYSDFVRPICLPLNETARPKVGDAVISSGWGDFPGAGVVTTIKKKVVHKLVPPPEDRRNNSDGLMFLEVFNTTITQDKEYDYDCSGDEGGPIMYKSKHRWYIEGLMSINSCLGVPSSRLSPQSIEWILDNMRP